MPFSHCVSKLALAEKLPIADLEATAKDYEAQGMAPNAAMVKAVEDAIELAGMEEAKIIRTVRAAFEADGGKKAAKKPKPEPAVTMPAHARDGSAQTSVEGTRERAIAGLKDKPTKALREIATGHERSYMRVAAADVMQERADATAGKRSDAMKKRMKQDAKIDIDSDHMLQAIAKMGGINRESASGRFRFAPEELSIKAKVGNLARHVFINNGGMTVDQAGAAMGELGYVSLDDNGKHDQSDWEDLLSRAAGGEEVYTASGMVTHAEESRFHEMEALRAKSEAEMQEIEGFADDLQQWADDHEIVLPEGAALYHDQNDQPLISEDDIHGYFGSGEEKAVGRQDQTDPEGKARASAETGTDASFLQAQTRDDLAAKDARANDQGVANKELADSQRDAFSLSAPAGSVTGEANAMSNSRQESMFGATHSTKKEVESTGHSMLATAVENKQAAFKKVKALREQLKEAAIGDKQAIRFDLMKATDRWNEFQRMEADAKEQIAKDAEKQGIRASIAYHGSPHKFDKFTLDHMGSGEGAQAYGWGLYFAGEKKVADYYRDGLSEPGNKGSMYTVDIPSDDQYLHLDKPLNEQPADVKAALKQIADTLPGAKDFTGPSIELYRAINAPSDWHTGLWAYNFIAKHLGDAKAASLALNERGVPGAMYADAMSRGKDDQTNNYVLYDEKSVSILEQEHAAKSTQTGISEGDAKVAAMVKQGTTADDLLAHIAAHSDSADNRALAAAMRKLGLKTALRFDRAHAGQKFSVESANAGNVRAGYRTYDDTALLYRDDGAEQSMLHELVHAATIRALAHGGLAAAQIKSLWNTAKNLPQFKGQYGIANAEEFIAEAYASPTFRQVLADTQVPNSNKSFWQKLVDIVRAIIGKSAVSESMLDAVMRAGPGLMADNHSMLDLEEVEHATIAGRIASAIQKRTRELLYAGKKTLLNRDASLTSDLPDIEPEFTDAEADTKYNGTWQDGVEIPLNEADTARVIARVNRTDWHHGSTDGKIGKLELRSDGALFLTSDSGVADHYAGNGGRTYTTKLSVRNPFFVATSDTTAGMEGGNTIKDLKAIGYDAIVPLDYGDIVVLSDSALQDGGAVRASIASTLEGAANDIASVRLPANYLVGDLFNQTGKLNWWHKTIGTMDNLARRAPAFKPVYDAVQSFIGDVSRYAVASADLAPTLLPKLENVADIIGKNRKKAVSAADTKAIGAPIFEGTLTWARDANGKPVKVADLELAASSLSTKQKAAILIQKGIIDDQQNAAWLGNPLDFYDGLIAKKYAESQLKAGVVWTDAELRGQFNLNDGQVGLYHEFRAAIDKSLSNLTISEMVKLGGKDAKGMLDRAINAGSLDKAALMLRDHFRNLAATDPGKTDMHLDTATQVMNLADRGQDLMDRGYAPLSRFGKYTVYVEKAGEQVYFGMFESKAEASMMARKMTAENPGASVLHGTVSEEAYKLFAGISPETIELFGSMVGLDAQTDQASSEVYQSYLKLAKNNRSAMKRMIERKGIAGFSEDAGRVLAGFIYSNARLTSGNAHLGDIDEAAQKIPRQQGELMDAAMQLREHIRNPQQGTALGGLMFAQFLGGSVASAMVNLTQPITMTLPYLSQFGGAGKATSRLLQAVKDARKDVTGDAALDKALKWAADEGIVAPQEIHYLQAQAQGKAGLIASDGTKAGDARAALNNTMSKVTLGWGKLFAMAELANRRITFIAAYRTAVEEGKPDPAKFAQEAVSQTQGTYNSGNKPKWARGAIGGLLLTFKQYSVAYLELLTRMTFAGEPGSKERAAGQRAALLMVAVLFLMSGADGLPFEQDLEDAIDGLLQRLGYNFSTKRSKQAFLTDVLGQGGADFALKGLSAVPGMPIDVAGRFGMGNLIPGTGLLTKKEDHTRDLGELAGPAGDLAQRAFSGIGKALGGDLAGAALDVSPAAVRNLAKGADMAATGSYNDARGYRVNDTTPLEAGMKAIGFQPNSTAAVQDAKGQALNMIAQNRMRSKEISEHWAQGLAAQDASMVQSARDALHDWNAKNPEAPIKVSMPGILHRVKAMKQDAVNRTQKTAPKALKEAVKMELADTRG